MDSMALTLVKNWPTFVGNPTADCIISLLERMELSSTIAKGN